MAASDLTTLANLKQWLGLQGKPITAITRANPGVVTCPGYGPQTNTVVGFSGLNGMTQLNGQTATITVIDANTFSIGIDTTAYGAYVNGGFVGPDDALLARLLTGFSLAVLSLIERTILSQAYTETRNGNGRPTMMVRQYPITAVSSVSVNGVAIPAQSAPNASGFTFDEDTIYLVGYRFDRGPQNVVLGYTAGFASTPLDLEQDAIEAMAFLYRERDRIGLASKAMAGETTAYLKDLPPHLVKRFDRYRRVVMPA